MAFIPHLSISPEFSVNRVSIKLFALTGAIICGAWAYLFYLVRQMNHLPMAEIRISPSAFAVWPLAEFALIYSMWALMMAAMMLPTALPTISAFFRYSQRQQSLTQLPTLWFVTGYLAVWCGFSLVLTGLQWVLHRLAWLSPMMENQQPLLAASILFLAGLYQLTPLKNACLRHCRTPFGFLVNEWRPGNWGAVRVGAKHGSMCLGCCWAQMLIMFAVGVMNLWGMVLITLFVILEKWLPGRTRVLSGGFGIFFLLWGLYWLTKS